MLQPEILIVIAVIIVLGYFVREQIKRDGGL